MRMIACSLTVLFFGAPALAVDRELLNVIVAGNTFARESIRTISLSFESHEPNNPNTAVIRGRYWREGDKWRIEHDDRAIGGGRQIKAVCDGNLRKGTTHSMLNGKLVPNGAVNPAREYGGVDDPWINSLMYMPFGSNLKGPLHDIVDRGTKVVLAEQSGDIATVRFETEKGFYEIGMSVSRNYQPISASGWGGGRSRDGRGEHRVVQFATPAPGIHFPEVVEYSHFREGKPYLHRRTHFTNIRVNEPIPASTFTLSFPRGLLVIDQIHGQICRVDGSGNLIPAPEYASASKGPASATAPEPVGTPMRASTSEPESLTWLFIPLGAVFLITSAVLIALKRIRDRRAT